MAVSQALSVTQVSQDVAGNSSQVRIRWTSQQTGDSWNGYTRTAYYYISINGGAETAYSISYTLPKNATTTLVDRTITVAHRADGTGSIRVRTWMDTRISAFVVEKSQSLTLTTIPRATTPALSATSLDMGQTLGITLNRATSSFTHDLSYKFEQASAWTAIASGVGASYSWTIPDLAAQIPDKTGGTIQIRCVTMSGTTVIGEKTASLTAMVPESVVPTISAVSIAEASAGIAEQFGAYIQNKSSLAVEITAAGAKGSTIQAYRTVIQGAVYEDDEFTSEILAVAGTSQTTVIVTDSRGRTASWTGTLTVLELTKPKIQRLSVYRVDMFGQPAPAGIYLCAEYQYSVPSLNGGNTAALILEGKRITEEQYTTIHTSSALRGTVVLKPLTPTFSSDYTYDIHLKVTDYFNQTAEAATTLPTEAVVMDINRSGTAVSVGKASETAEDEELYEIAWPAWFRESAQVDGDFNVDGEITQDGQPIRFDPLDAMPVGYVYISVSATSPASLFGGTWEQIEDTFLLAAGSTYAAGSTGGEATHTLAKAELPAEKYRVGWDVSSVGGTGTWYLTYNNLPNSGGGYASAVITSIPLGDWAYTEPLGSGQAHNNMPPYLAVYMWKRVA